MKGTLMANYRTLFGLQGKSAWVVGAGSGIGQAAARGLAAFGAHVLCADVKLVGAGATAAQIQQAGHRAEAVHRDMRDGSMIQAARGQIGTVDVLVATPSINVRKPLLAISDEEFDRIIQLNLKGTFLLLRNVGRVMAEQGRGSIIVFSSIRAQVVEPG